LPSWLTLMTLLFMAPGDMEVRIGEYCHRTGQTPPAGKGGIIRVLLEGLALKYRWLLERLEDLIGRRIEVIHIVGGGTQNKLLNQFAANATGRRVVTGPVEATSIGNILMQMLAVGQISSLNEGRELIKRSFPVETYEPQDTEQWQDGRFLPGERLCEAIYVSGKMEDLLHALCGLYLTMDQVVG
jgi:rhamnulokinase